MPRGIADVLAYAPRQGLIQIDRRTAVPTPVQFREAHRLLKEVLELDPRNPTHYETLARWYERHSLLLPPASPLTGPYLEQAAAHLKHAARLRPSSPYTWANLAVVKQRLGQLDAEFQQAVVNAARLGPWEPDVQLALAGIVFSAHSRLEPRTRAAAMQPVANALRRYDRELFQLARRHGALNLLCTVPGVGASRLAVACI